VIKTRLCELLGIQFPIIQAGMSIYTSAELVAAVSNAGGLGSLGCWRRPLEDLEKQLAIIRERTDRPFAVNHVVPALDEVEFALTLAARPAVISLALADPGELVQRAHDAGILVIHQVSTVVQARQAAERGVDVIIAQGGESGGFAGTVAALALIPQVVDAVRPIPVVAAGGIADGRGLAAALVLGAEGINVGTRFLASEEAPISQVWKHMIVEAVAEDAIPVEVLNDISPMPGSYGYGTVVRSLRTPFIEMWQQRRDEARREADRLRRELLAATQQGRNHETFPAAGQSAGLIYDIAPAGEIVQRIVAEAQSALEQSHKLLT
jgi:nitronate monooxygenase/enoyl-[acyl-carrier protein] reductase II